jgi:hypothetical protein
MQTQLVDRYLKDSQCQHGLYLVGWFDCSVWQGAKMKMPIDEARTHFQHQASDLSKGDRQIRAFVLDASLH